MKKENKVLKSIKRLFVHLFGFGSNKKDVLEEEEIISPSKQIFQKFIRNRIAMFGIILFTAIVLFVAIGNRVIDFDPSYNEGSQQYLEPNRSYLKIPKGLKKSGVKVVNGEYLIGGGSAFTVAISNDNKIYVWGSSTNGVKKVPQEIKDKAADIVQLSVGRRHIVALTKDGEFLGWGSNGFKQAQKPVYNEKTDGTFYQQLKTIEAYFFEEARMKYPEAVVTTIEEDPIVKVVAGNEYTSILTTSGIVYNWGSTNTSKIGEPENSFRFIENIRIQYFQDKLQWSYSHAYQYATIATKEELIEQYQIPEKEYFDIEFMIFQNEVLRWHYKKLPLKKEDEEKLGLTPEEITEIENQWHDVITVQEIIDSIPKRKIVNIYGLERHVVYEFDDNRMQITGDGGLILSNVPVDFFHSAEERGYRITKVVSTKDNVFALTSNNTVFGWGPSDSSNRNIEIPAEVASKKIVDIEAGSYHLVVLDDQGEVLTWGSKNDLNQLNIPKKLKKSKKIEANFFISYSIGEDDSITVWGNKGYIFGTNFEGGDVFKRLIAGGSMTLSLALVAVVISLFIGLAVGLIAGFYGKWVDNVLMRFGEIINAFPFLPLALTLAKLVEEWELEEKARVYFIMVILGLLSWPGLARLVRGQILSEREKDFVMAAKALGIRERNIILRHILPNVINVVIVNTTLSYAGALLTESGLSFLGFGVKLPNPSWGNMLTTAQKLTVLSNYWWLWIIPGIFIVLTALSINLVGDGLRDAMDPKDNER